MQGKIALGKGKKDSWLTRKSCYDTKQTTLGYIITGYIYRSMLEQAVGSAEY